MGVGGWGGDHKCYKELTSNAVFHKLFRFYQLPVFYQHLLVCDGVHVCMCDGVHVMVCMCDGVCDGVHV